MTDADASSQVSREDDEHVPSRELDHLRPRLRQDRRALGPTGTIEAPVEHLDLATLIKVLQVVSSEIVPEKVLETVMRTARIHPADRDRVRAEFSGRCAVTKPEEFAA